MPRLRLAMTEVDFIWSFDNELASLAGVTPSSVYSMMDPTRRNVSIVLIKKLCDGLELSLGEFFSAPEFDELEQEIC